MLHLADVHVVFEDFSTEYVIGKWYVNFSLKSGLGSQESLSSYFIEQYKKQGKKVRYLGIWKNKKKEKA